MGKDNRRNSESSKKEEKSESTAEDSKQREASRPATIYFMEWTRTALAHYTTTINELFSKPLIEHCTKTKIADERLSAEQGRSARSAEIAKLANEKSITTRGDHDQLVTRLKEAASRVTEWSNTGEHIMNVRNKEVTLAEMAAMYRLRTLIKISANLVELIARAKIWTKENVTKEFQQFLRESSKNEYKSEGDSTLVIGNPRDYIPHLECRINHYRTCVHLIGSALITTIQTYMNSISLEQMDLRTREVKEVLDRLPPMYTKVATELKFSDYTTKLIQEYPPNKLQFPMAPQVDTMDPSKRRSGGSVEKEDQGTKKVVKESSIEKQREKIVNSKESDTKTIVAVKKEKEVTQPSVSES